MMVSALKHVINNLSAPYFFLPLAMVCLFGFMFGYRTLTKPWIALSLFASMVLFFVCSLLDTHFRWLVTQPDSVPIVGLFLLVLFFIWLAFRQAAINDERLERGEKPREALESEDKVFSWPDLVFSEFLATVIVAALLIVWSILVKAPLEQPATTAVAPNPAKAPWYFLGLQEQLVYFDPWFAGVLVPSLIILGLMAIPYLDTNPRGQGYYTFKERRFAISVFMFGFIVLWISIVIQGTFLRGPNWNFFGPYENWDPTKSPPLVNVDLAQYFWVYFLGKGLPSAWYIRELPGLAFLVLFFTVPPLILAKTVFQKFYQRMGTFRYSIMVQLLLFMTLIVLKMFLRWTVNLKYFVHIARFSLNI